MQTVSGIGNLNPADACRRRELAINRAAQSVQSSTPGCAIVALIKGAGGDWNEELSAYEAWAGLNDHARLEE